MKRRNFLKNTARFLLLGGLLSGVARLASREKQLWRVACGVEGENDSIRQTSNSKLLTCRNCPIWNACKHPQAIALKTTVLKETAE